MNTHASILPLAILGLASSPLSAGETPATVTQAPTPSRWRFGAAYAPIIGLKTEFDGLGTFNSTHTPQPLGGGQGYGYDDGFVHLDSSGNEGDQTWNWGYDNDSQLNASGSGSIAMSITNSAANAGVTDDGQDKSGVECFAAYDMGKVGIPFLRDLGATWGFKGGIHYARIDTSSLSTLTSSTGILTDRFDLGGNIAPLAPFVGSYEGPSVLIGDSPIRSYSTGEAMVDGSRELDVHLTTLNLGTYLEIPVSRKFHLTFEGGLSAAVADGSYDFQSNTTITGLGTSTSSGSTSDVQILPGAYAGLGGIYQINDSWAILASGRYQYLESFDLETNGSSASLSFGSAFVLSVGVVYSF